MSCGNQWTFPMKIQVFRHVGSALAVCNRQPSELEFKSVDIKLRAVCIFPPFAKAWDQLIHEYKPRHSLLDGRIDRVWLIGYLSLAKILSGPEKPSLIVFRSSPVHIGSFKWNPAVEARSESGMQGHRLPEFLRTKGRLMQLVRSPAD